MLCTGALASMRSNVTFTTSANDLIGILVKERFKSH